MRGDLERLAEDLPFVKGQRQIGGSENGEGGAGNVVAKGQLEVGDRCRSVEICGCARVKALVHREGCGKNWSRRRGQSVYLIFECANVDVGAGFAGEAALVLLQ